MSASHSATSIDLLSRKGVRSLSVKPCHKGFTFIVATLINSAILHLIMKLYYYLPRKLAIREWIYI